MSIEDRRVAVKELAAEGESNRGIAAVLGVDESTARDAKRAGNPAVDDDEVSGGAVPSEASAGNPAPLSAVAALAADDKIRAAAQRAAEKESRRREKEGRKSALNLGSKRPKLIKRIKELQPDASQRTIAKAVGVDHSTVSRNLGASAPSNAAKSLKGKDQKSENGANAPPWLAKPASETADKLRAAARIAETRQAGEDKGYFQYFPAYTSGPRSHSLRSSVGIWTSMSWSDSPSSSSSVSTAPKNSPIA